MINPGNLQKLLSACLFCMALSSCSIALFDDLALDASQQDNPLIVDSIINNRENHHAWFLRGRELIRRGDVSEALIAFRKATELKPDYEEAWVGIGYAHLREKKWKKAQTAFEELLMLHPEAPEGIEGLAISLFEQGQNDRAKELCEQALGYDNELFRAHQIMGRIHYSQLEYEKAEEHWRLALLYGASPSDLEPIYQDLKLYRQKYE